MLLELLEFGKLVACSRCNLFSNRDNCSSSSLSLLEPRAAAAAALFGQGELRELDETYDFLVSAGCEVLSLT